MVKGENFRGEIGKSGLETTTSIPDARMQSKEKTIHKWLGRRNGHDES
jgi:hypothetical protein